MGWLWLFLYKKYWLSRFWFDISNCQFLVFLFPVLLYDYTIWQIQIFDHFFFLYVEFYIFKINGEIEDPLLYHIYIFKPVRERFFILFNLVDYIFLFSQPVVKSIYWPFKETNAYEFLIFVSCILFKYFSLNRG